MIIYWRIVNRLVIPEKYSESQALKKKKIKQFKYFYEDIPRKCNINKATQIY